MSKTNDNHPKVIKLKQAKRYNTYQFYAEMDNKNIDLFDGLKIGALTCLSWLRDRLKDTADYKELDLPSEQDYKKVDISKFNSFLIDSGYKICVKSLFDEGMWSLKIIENDTGFIEDEIIPGRTVESDIGFRIVDKKLECGFRVTINDLDDVKIANSIRFSVVKKLAENSMFGLKQINNLFNQETMFLTDDKSILDFKEILESNDNQLPFIIYAYEDGFSKVKDIKREILPSVSIDFDQLPEETQDKIIANSGSQIKDIESKAPAYLSRYLGYGRVYCVPAMCFDKVAKIINLVHIEPNEVFVVSPDNKEIKRYHYEDKDVYIRYFMDYTREKKYDFHDVMFYDELNRYNEQLKNKEFNKEKDSLLDKIKELETILSQNQRKDRIDSHVSNNISSDELDKANKIIKSLEEEIKLLTIDRTRIKDELERKTLILDYYKRKESFPKTHTAIPDWASSFKYVVLNRKAVDCLNRNDAENVDVKVICESLDYLENVYSKQVFFNANDDYVNNLSSIIYNRPYEVTPSGIPVSCKGDCKIKYAFEGEKNREHILDQHLKVGAHGELIRVYFIIDKQRKKIVVGSLPNHLEY